MTDSSTIPESAARVKANTEGRKCPAWCITDHEAERYSSCTGPEHGPHNASAGATWRCFGDDPEVAMWVSGANGFHAVYADTAQRGAWLAEVLDGLAAMTKPQIRALAANVRKASAEVWPEAEAG